MIIMDRNETSNAASGDLSPLLGQRGDNLPENSEPTAVESGNGYGYGTNTGDSISTKSTKVPNIRLKYIVPAISVGVSTCLLQGLTSYLLKSSLEQY